MPRFPRSSIAVLTAVALAGCAEAAPAPTAIARDSVVILPRDESALFQTDSLRYTLADGDVWYEARIVTRFRNATTGPVYFVNCQGATMLHLEKQVDGQWVSALAPIMPLCLSAPITITAGASYDLNVPVIAAHPNTNAAPKFTVVEIPGVYRIVWSDALNTYQDRLPFGTPLPLDQRVSNRFVLTLPSR
jgi:hypothetical protein